MSTFHLFAGLTVFAVALGGMFVLATVLEKWHARRSKPPKQAAPSGAKAQPVQPARRTWIHLGGAVAIVAGGLVVCATTDIAYRVGPPGIKLELPTMLAGFVSDEKPMSAKEQSLLNEDVRIERRLYLTNERAILAALVLSGAEKRSLHSPDVCLPTQGWSFTGQTTLPIDLGNGSEANATLITMQRDSQAPDGRRVRERALNIYWYQGSDDTTCASYNEHVSRTYVDAVFRNMNHRWALISFYIPLRDQLPGMEDPYAELAALEQTQAFIRQLMPQVLVPHTAGGS